MTWELKQGPCVKRRLGVTSQYPMHIDVTSGNVIPGHKVIVQGIVRCYKEG